MASFAFVPRSVQKKQDPSNRKSTSKPAVHLPPGGESGISATPANTSASVGGGTQTEKDAQQKDEEYLALLELSFSDHALWCNPDLRHRVESGTDGYLHLQYFISQSPFISSLDPKPSEAELMRCIRSSSGTALEARMLISEPSRSEWFDRGPGGSGYHQKSTGGFEVRRKDWENVHQKLAQGTWNKHWWDECTVYVERLPAAYRSIQTVVHYVQSLLSTQGTERDPAGSHNILVQSVTFPPHHLATPDALPRCKGFAFVVLGSPALVKKLSQSYPWNGSSTLPNADQEASRFGMRVLRKGSWDKLKTGYLAYQQRLLAQVAEDAAASELQDAAEQNISPHGRESSHYLADMKASTPSETQSNSTWYPQNCLAFVRNIHPETNKTTLRALFNGALNSSTGGVDYVDFNKGIDSVSLGYLIPDKRVHLAPKCHLRLASPSATAELVSHFTTHPIAQQNGLDQIGSVCRNDRAGIHVEMVQGKREELYWEKVPEKVRNAAVERLKGTRDGGAFPREPEGSGGRKRQKKG